MTATPQGLQTPQRSTFNIFGDVQQASPFTPCTGLSRMTLNSTSNGNQRFKSGHYQLPTTSFTEKLMSAVREEEEDEPERPHPNLDMFLSADRISIFDKTKNDVFSYSEDEESDEGDLFSSSLCPMSSPERQLTRASIFDDEPMNSLPRLSLSLNKKSIFDDDEDDDEEIDEAMQEDDDYCDLSSVWLSQIFSDNNSPINETACSEEDSESDDEEEENRPPRFFSRATANEKRRILPTTTEDNNNSSSNERLPLREIRFEQDYSDDDLPAKKKSLLASGKSQKMRFMRTLSPPRFIAKRKV